MAKIKSIFAGIPRSHKRDAAQDALIENIELLTGQRGDSRALLVSDLVDLDAMAKRALRLAASSGQTGNGLPKPPSTSRIERPHAPVNISGTGGFTFIALTWDNPTYKGHAYAEIWRSDDNVFANAVKVATEVTNIFSDAVNMASSYYYWVRFVNKADMTGPTQGANGILVVTQASADTILAELGGAIEKSHLGTFLTTEVDKIPGFEVDIPVLQGDMYDATGEVQTAKANALDAQGSAATLFIESENTALNLINAALLADQTWQNNTVKLIAMESSVVDVKAQIAVEIYTKAEATEAIAAASQTIRTEIEASGIILSGDIANTYYTKTTADTAIALADSNLKALIEDPFGTSLGATLNNSYYTSVDTDTAISTYGTTLKAAIEDINGSSIGADLVNNYYTSAAADSAISAANTTLKATIDSEQTANDAALLSTVNADLAANYYTKVSADSAISVATTALKATIDSEQTANDAALLSTVNADLAANYYTKVNADSAIASADTALKAVIEDPSGTSLGATLFTSYQTKANADQSVARSLSQLSSEFDVGLHAALESALANDLEIDRQRVIEANFITQQQVITDNAQAQADNLVLLEAQFDISEASALQLTKAVADNNSATAQSLLQLNASIDATDANLEQNYYTLAQADSAIAAADTTLKAAVDADTAAINADLVSNYYTSAATDSAISSATTALQAIIDADTAAISANLLNNYYTKVNADSAIASADTALKAVLDGDIGAINSELQTNYYTSAAADSAITTATTQLKTAIEDTAGTSIGADLYSNYYTKTTADSAISQANTILKTAIEDINGSSIGASLQILSQTVADNDGDVWALWGVKSTVAGLTSSLGLVNDGVDPIFAVKGAKFAIITDQNPTVTTPVFSVVGNKTVMTSALIDEAHIQTLVTDDLISNRLLVGLELTTPSINYNTSNGARSGNFSIDPSGNLVCTNASVKGHIEAESGYFKGAVYAEQIVGDVFNSRRIPAPAGGNWSLFQEDNLTVNNWLDIPERRIMTLVVPSLPLDRELTFKNLQLGIDSVSRYGITKFNAYIDARNSAGETVASFEVGDVGLDAADGGTGWFYNRAAGYSDVIRTFGTVDRYTEVIAGVPLAANETTLTFWFRKSTFQQPAGGSLLYLKYGAAISPVPFAEGLDHIDIESTVIGTASGVTVSG